jgi:uncharacterized protein DUF6010
MAAGYLITGLIGGVVLSAVAFLLSRYTRDIVGRALLAGVLIAAAVFYVVFANRAGESTAWLVVELAGVAVYGTVGLVGVWRSPMWLAAGWALHPVWDVALHYFGPGNAFAPAAYTIACLSWDLAVAAYIVVAYRSGWVGEATRRPVAVR